MNVLITFMKQNNYYHGMVCLVATILLIGLLIIPTSAYVAPITKFSNGSFTLDQFITYMADVDVSKCEYKYCVIYAAVSKKSTPVSVKEATRDADCIAKNNCHYVEPLDFDRNMAYMSANADDVIEYGQMGYNYYLPYTNYKVLNLVEAFLRDDQIKTIIPVK